MLGVVLLDQILHYGSRFEKPDGLSINESVRKSRLGNGPLVSRGFSMNAGGLTMRPFGLISRNESCFWSPLEMSTLCTL